ncbi:MAG: ATP-binding SpoIIE family protein phosphatase [Pseudomonadota bacterium]
MEKSLEKTVDVIEQSQVAEVRRVAAELARAELMSEAEKGRLAIIATEVSTNLVKYGVRGSVTLNRYAEAGVHGVELVAMDHGPGLRNLAMSMRDGHSTAGSLGIGLGSVKRAATFLDIYTLLGQGTAVLARVQAGSQREVPVQGQAAYARTVPKKGQIESGDGWSEISFGTRRMVCLVDGLGHGPLAALAANRALAAFQASGALDSPEDVLLRAHQQLKDTRGAVMAVLQVDARTASATFCGVGNINATLVHEGKSRHLLSIEGIVGYNMRKTRVQQSSWEPGDVAIMNTDGLSSRWSITRYPGLEACHPALIASVLFRDHARDTDDATIVTLKAA